jgi:hypothetical protein
MPGLRLHLTTARDLAADLGAERLTGALGAYYLGATTPDIRAMTRWDRERTHFFRLDEFEHQDGVDRLFAEQPALRDASALDPLTAAFMAGYISHLVLDEDYITRIYRPLFGERSDLRDDALADVMDKMLQWDVERLDCEDTAKVDGIRRALAEAAVDISIDFISREELARWRDVSLDVISQPATVERLVRFLGRRLGKGLDDAAEASRFADGVPSLLERTWAYVGEERVREYMRDARERASRAMREYLS